MTELGLGVKSTGPDQEAENMSQVGNCATRQVLSLKHEGAIVVHDKKEQGLSSRTIGACLKRDGARLARGRTGLKGAEGNRANCTQQDN